MATTKTTNEQLESRLNHLDQHIGSEDQPYLSEQARALLTANIREKIMRESIPKIALYFPQKNRDLSHKDTRSLYKPYEPMRYQK